MNYCKIVVDRSDRSIERSPSAVRCAQDQDDV